MITITSWLAVALQCMEAIRVEHRSAYGSQRGLGSWIPVRMAECVFGSADEKLNVAGS